MCSACAAHVHRMCTACAPHDDAPLRPVYAAYTLCVRCVCTACTVHARCVCTARAGGPFRAAAAPRRVLVGRRGTRGGRGARGGARRRRASAASALAQRWPGTYGRATEVQGAVPRRAAAGLLVVYSRRMAHCKLGVHTLHTRTPTMHTACPLTAPMQVYSLRSAALLRAVARARWAALLAAWRRARGGGLHVGEKKIRRAARRLYATRS